MREQGLGKSPDKFPSSPIREHSHFISISAGDGRATWKTEKQLEGGSRVPGTNWEERCVREILAQEEQGTQTAKKYIWAPILPQSRSCLASVHLWNEPFLGCCLFVQTLMLFSGRVNAEGFLYSV